MQYTISFLENKSPEWKVATLEDEGGNKIEEVSINKVSKKGEPFPNFDELMSGHKVTGELWQSPAGKHYLFPPKLVKTQFKPFGGGIKAAQERKAEMIHNAQDKKEASMEILASFRDATVTMSTLYSGKDITEAEYKQRWISWRDWLMERFAEIKDPYNKQPF